MKSLFFVSSNNADPKPLDAKALNIQTKELCSSNDDWVVSFVPCCMLYIRGYSLFELNSSEVYAAT